MDYSQIELRLMAHYSKDPIMLNSFRNDEDIHKRTAAEIFGVKIDDVDGQMRRRAKTINFGLLYGMSAFGLSNQLEVSRAEADIFLNNYFERYSAVKSFMSKIVEEAKKDKFVKTLYKENTCTKHRSWKLYDETRIRKSCYQWTFTGQCCRYY